MFGMGFMEIFLVLIVAIIALGPEKLPSALVEGAKFFKKIKGELSDAKSSLDKELNMSELKEDAEKLKASVSNIQNMANIDLDDIAKSAEPKQVEQKETTPSDTKKSKKEKISLNKDKEA